MWVEYTWVEDTVWVWVVKLVLDTVLDPDVKLELDTVWVECRRPEVLDLVCLLGEDKLLGPGVS